MITTCTYNIYIYVELDSWNVTNQRVSRNDCDRGRKGRVGTGGAHQRGAKEESYREKSREVCHFYDVFFGGEIYVKEMI